MAEINEEYEKGFKDGLKSKIGDELLPMIEQILIGVSDAVKSVIPLMIDRMETKANLDSNDWIPCSERLPEESGTYICAAKSAGRNIVIFVKWQSRYKQWDLTGARSYWQITHWQPLPEPPKIGGIDNVDS